MRLVVPFPMSLNHAWVNQARGKGRFLTKEAKRFKVEVRAEVLREHLGSTSSLGRDDNLLMRIHLFGPPELFFSKGWPKAAEHRHKAVDISNRIKVLEDAVFEALGLDDSQVQRLEVERFTVQGIAPHACVELEKYESTEQNRAEATMRASGPVDPQRRKRGGARKNP